MMPPWLEASAAGFITLSGLSMLALSHWRASLGLLALQYTFVFLALRYLWTPVSAISFLVTAWLCIAILALAISGMLARSAEHGKEDDLVELTRALRSDFQYPLTLGAFVALIAFTRRTDLALWLGYPSSLITYSGIMLVSLGLLKFGTARIAPDSIISWSMAFAGLSLLIASGSRADYVGVLSLLLLSFTLMGAYALTNLLRTETIE